MTTSIFGKFIWDGCLCRTAEGLDAVRQHCATVGATLRQHCTTVSTAAACNVLAAERRGGDHCLLLFSLYVILSGGGVKARTKASRKVPGC